MMKPPTRRWLGCAIFLGIIAALLSGCGSSAPQQNLSAEQRFQQGKLKFGKGDYLEAISDLEIIRLQFPGSKVADSAQYLLGESHFKMEEYLLAAEEYQALKRNMPASPLVPMAQYKVGLCYYSLSPKTPLDQTYTTRAIDEFQTFIEYNPKHELVPDAEGKIKELNGRLAKKGFEAATLYMKMGYFRAATNTFDNVIEKFHDTPYAEPALLGKVKALMARKKYDEAEPEIEKFLTRYPSSEHNDEAKALEQEIRDHLKTKSEATFPGDASKLAPQG
jgi:outer membrane protein assembly factor BamD